MYNENKEPFWEDMMGLLGKLGQKIGDAMEKSASKNMTGASKEAYEAEKSEKEILEKENVLDEMIEISYSKDDLKNLDLLIKRANLIDERKIWVAGFSNFRANQNASAANLFSGKKHLRFFCVKQDVYSFAFFEDDMFKTYRIFRDKDILKTETKTKMLGAGTLKIELKDGKVFTIDVTENKDKLQTIKGMFK